jgi:hypothetical protein
MGLNNAIDRVSGPYASMLQALSNHMAAVLVPGRCLDATSGALRLTSANTITWQSKVFIGQYAAEAVLGITNNSVDGDVDQSDVSVQIQGAPFQGYSDSFITTTGALQGGHHYPRGVTSALWWLNASNNPAYPSPAVAPIAPTVLYAAAGDGQVLLEWQGVPFATGYNLKRATQSGGSYAPVTNGILSASFADSGLSNGTTYYYILTATNQIGESAASTVLAATPVPSVGTNLSSLLSASKLTISWPSSYVGWILQTNTVGLSNPGAWVDVPGSVTNSQLAFPAGSPNPIIELFRLRHP